MSPEQQLEFIEARQGLADLLGSLRDALIEKGWSEHGAEQAAMLIYQTGSRPPSIFG